jgi:DNA modification methylase
MVSLESLIPYARNARTHSDDQVALIAGSIREFGFNNPVLVDGARGIVAGHGRLLAARKLGMTTIPVIELAHLNENQKRAYILADNKLAERAGWDLDMLKLELADLGGVTFESIGFTADELRRISGPGGGLTDPDETPEAPAAPVSRLGDLWTLGSHRLLCGDSTMESNVERLMTGSVAVLMQTDPPYGIAYVANAKTKGQSQTHADIENDELDGPKLQAFLEACIRAAVPHLTETAAFYLWHPMLTQGTFFAAAAAAAAADILIHRQIVWAKPSLVFGRGDYHWQHELCFYGWRRGHRPPFFGERNQTTLWNVGRETSKDHPTAKPVALWGPPIANHTRAGEVIYEPFSGSGSQIIAAEQTGRHCYSMELSPSYVDVAVLRWQAFTGKVATLEGRSFDEVAKERRAN